MKLKTWILTSGLILPCLALADLTVIEDLGGQSAIPYYQSIQPVHSDNAPHHPNAIPSQITEAQMLPVISRKWTVGRVNTQKINLPGATPIFLIGADDVSMQWLEENADKLQKIGAVGLVINVNTMEELQKLKNLTPQLQLLPTPADTLAERLGISSYPLLITAEEISQ